MASGDNTLGKVSRLSGKKSIATLLADGKWGSYGHFRYCWLVPAASGKGPVCVPQGDRRPGIALPDEPTQASVRPGRVLISVPKRFFKRAVKRNLLKRRIREAYRVQKLAGVDVMFQYNSADLADFATIMAEVTEILARIANGLPYAGRKTPENLPEP